MLELLNAAVSSVNIIPTALLVIILLYWITVIIGLADVNVFDIDEINLDADADGGEVHFSVDWLNHILLFFNITQVPLMLFLTFLILPVWVISVLGNHYLGNASFVFSLILLIPNFFVSLFIAKILTTPFVKLFAYMNKEEEEEEVIGKICVTMVSISNERIGQAKVNTSESPLLLNVKTKPGTTLKAGETGLIVDYNRERNIYLIEPYETL
jgi:hypothetical protein